MRLLSLSVSCACFSPLSFFLLFSLSFSCLDVLTKPVSIVDLRSKLKTVMLRWQQTQRTERRLQAQIMHLRAAEHHTTQHSHASAHAHAARSTQHIVTNQLSGSGSVLSSHGSSSSESVDASSPSGVDPLVGASPVDLPLSSPGSSLSTASVGSAGSAGSGSGSGAAAAPPVAPASTPAGSALSGSEAPHPLSPTRSPAFHTHAPPQ